MERPESSSVAKQDNPAPRIKLEPREDGTDPDVQSSNVANDGQGFLKIEVEDPFHGGCYDESNTDTNDKESVKDFVPQQLTDEDGCGLIIDDRFVKNLPRQSGNRVQIMPRSVGPLCESMSLNNISSRHPAASKKLSVDFSTSVKSASKQVPIAVRGRGGTDLNCNNANSAISPRLVIGPSSRPVNSSQLLIINTGSPTVVNFLPIVCAQKEDEQNSGDEKSSKERQVPESLDDSSRKSCDTDDDRLQTEKNLGTILQKDGDNCVASVPAETTIKSGCEKSCDDQSVMPISSVTEKSSCSISTFIGTSSKDKSLKCSVCGKTFSKQNHLQIHEFLCSVEPIRNERFMCRFCDKGFPQKSHLKRHEFIHTGKPLKCDLCEKSFVQKRDLKNHQLKHAKQMEMIAKFGLHNGKIKRKFACSFCDKTFTRRFDLKRHEHKHTQKPLFQCDVCDETFGKKRDLKKHQCKNLIGVNEPRRYPCRFCSKTFAGSRYVKKHEYIHTGNKPYHCQYCQRRFTYRSDLRHHEAVHTGMKEYLCEVCGKLYPSKQGLVTHQLLMHTSGKSFKCDRCEKAFRTKKKLVSHQVVHGDKRFKCEICNKAFFWRRSLDCHKRTHTGEKPFNCELCGKAFAYSTSLVKHRRAHRGLPSSNRGAQVQDEVSD